MIQITEEDLHNIVTDAIKHILKENSNLLLEYAVERGIYVTSCLNQAPIVLKHIAKVCIFENTPHIQIAVNHWKNEIAAQIYGIMKVKVKNDNKSGDKAKRAFVDGFIYGLLGENFKDYDDIISYFNDALEDEGMSKEEIEKIPYAQIAIDNKDRIINYLMSFVPLIQYVNNPIELKEKIKETVQKL